MTKIVNQQAVIAWLQDLKLYKSQSLYCIQAMSNWNLKLKRILFILALIKMKYLSILTKYLQDLYEEKYKIDKRHQRRTKEMERHYTSMDKKTRYRQDVPCSQFDFTTMPVRISGDFVDTGNRILKFVQRGRRLRMTDLI